MEVLTGLLLQLCSHLLEVKKVSSAWRVRFHIEAMAVSQDPVLFSYILSDAHVLGYDYPCGGAGMLLSAAAYSSIAPLLFTDACPFLYYNDLTLGHCIHARGIPMVRWTAPHLDGKEDECERNELASKALHAFVCPSQCRPPHEVRRFNRRHYFLLIVQERCQSIARVWQVPFNKGAQILLLRFSLNFFNASYCIFVVPLALVVPNVFVVSYASMQSQCEGSVPFGRSSALVASNSYTKAEHIAVLLMCRYTIPTCIASQMSQEQCVR
eukprot:2431574-Amphidinium_carterae.1